MSHLIAVSSPLQQKHLKRVSEWQSGRVAGTVLYMLYMNIWQHGKFAFMWQKRIISFFKIIPDFILVQQCYLQWRIVWFMRPWIHGEYLQNKNPTDYCVAPTIRKSFDLTIIVEKSSRESSTEARPIQDWLIQSNVKTKALCYNSSPVFVYDMSIVHRFDMFLCCSHLFSINVSQL